ncbi:glycine/betaine ABC transporter [Terribacillus saccharophilus]|uniref:glycine betaine ABC transporter substrate-binding protein n=1 Tax=Terribacillus saccharophilus TaxID=361277 RepID=UPI000BA542AF|nr:glycine betaine ABC transporter substrate-binding protein [Terribacillus saccharophilus]PAF17648.1 glycine/betaine ABC transporter [Terribacillus saccharophilus]PAF21504.1 glycine/betaine ABC transporter [Terribacillus saccharophilus]PAF38066.1 glycine/betaine ABC transporter [Terribacillus saccharophilus]PAF39201.1 glycine/betaine ABC transporter [Terribacillus saccharophilus]
MKKWKPFGVAIGLAMTLVAAGCGNDTSSSDSLSEQVDYTIVGIEAGAGVMKATENAIDDYQLDGWTIMPSSSGVMTIALEDAIEDKKPVVITGWTPHWMFAKYDLKYLDDPKGSYGEAESLHTLTRQGFADDVPGANKVLDQFNWSVKDMEEVMLEVNKGAEPAEAARKWVDKHADKVSEWTKDAEEGNGQEVSLVYVEWDSEVASTNVLKVVLDDLGYKTEITPLDNAIMWQAVVQGEADATASAWLPTTHGDLYEQYKDQVVDLGASLEGARTGLVVPSYVDADSIEDLNPKDN